MIFLLLIIHRKIILANFKFARIFKLAKDFLLQLFVNSSLNYTGYFAHCSGEKVNILPYLIEQK